MRSFENPAGAARHRQAAIAGVHHKIDVLGGNQIGSLAQAWSC